MLFKKIDDSIHHITFHIFSCFSNGNKLVLNNLCIIIFVSNRLMGHVWEILIIESSYGTCAGTSLSIIVTTTATADKQQGSIFLMKMNLKKTTTTIKLIQCCHSPFCKLALLVQSSNDGRIGTVTGTYISSFCHIWQYDMRKYTDPINYRSFSIQKLPNMTYRAKQSPTLLRMFSFYFFRKLYSFLLV